MSDTERIDTLKEIRLQRADVWRHLMALEKAVATPIPGRAAEWAAVVHEALVELAATFERHIAVTEGPGGLFSEVLESAPRLDSAVDELRTEHEQVSRMLGDELRSLRAIDGQEDVGKAFDCRHRLTALLAQLLAHRQAGADLVYEAYAVDIGVGD
jgi:hypothetical protein